MASRDRGPKIGRVSPVTPTERTIARDAIIRECSAGHPTTELFRRVSARLGRVVPFAAAGWLATDPATLLYTGAVTEGVDAALHHRLFENELLEPDFAKFARILSSSRPAITLHEATEGQPELSPRHLRIHRPNGLEGELRTVFATGGSCWGVACLTRAEGEPGFSADDVAFVASVTEHVAHGLRVALLADEALTTPAEDAPGMIVLGPGGEVESLTESAERWLSLLPPEHPGPDAVLPSPIQAVALRARGALAGEGGDVPRARVRLASGRWLTVHAAALQGTDPPRTAIMLEPTRRAELAAIVVALYELTERERQVTELLVRGLPIDEIAQGLWLSRHTIRDHVKAIYSKVGVSSRPELTARLFAEHYAPPA